MHLGALQKLLRNFSKRSCRGYCSSNINFLASRYVVGLICFVHIWCKFQDLILYADYSLDFTLLGTLTS